MKITYSALCASCKIAGKEIRLHRDLNDPEVVSCSEGHKFTGPEIEEYLTAEPDVQVVPESKPAEKFIEPPPLPKEVGEIQESMQKAFDKSFEMAPPPVMEAPKGSATAKAIEDVREEAARKMQAQPATKAPKSAPAAVGTLVEEPAPESQSAAKFSQRPARKLPGGRLLIEVEISDQHASFLMGEAETRGKTVEEHFREIIEFGLESRWFF
jgi:hypothetical protein